VRFLVPGEKRAATAYGIAEAVGAERSVSRRFSEAPLFLGLFSGLVAIGALVALLPGNLIQLLINMQILNGLITPIILTFTLVLANRRSVLGPAVNSPRFRAVATVCIALVGALAAFVLAEAALSWIGA
jgi:Mn2+/Fe2+ NRAMP family transporter